MKSPARRLLRLAAPFAGWMALSASLGLATIASGIGLMATSAFIIAKAALHPSIADLQVAIVGVRFFGIARGVFRYLERYVSHHVTFRLLARLRVWFYRSLEPLAPARLMDYKSGDLLSRSVADIETLEHFYVRVIAPPLVAALVGVLMAAWLASFSLWLAVTLLACLAAAGLGVPLLTHKLSRGLGRGVVAVRADLHAALVDGVQGAADLLAFGQEERHQARVRALSRELAGLQGRSARIGGLHAALTGLSMNLATLAMLLVAIPLVGEGRLDGVYLALLVLAAIASFEAVAPLPLAVQYLENCLEAGRRLFEIVDAQPVVHDPPSPAPPPGDHSLLVENLSFRYQPDEPPALEGVSLSLPPGGCLAVVGPSGAGKSTLVNLLLRFWEYETGRIVLGGRELRDYQPESLHRMMGVVAQDTHLFNATLRENLLIARPDAAQSDLAQAIRQAQLQGLVQALPHGYDTWLGEGGLRLSGGERQRVAIARALLKDAPLLILDEATANLDPLTEREIMEAIRRLMARRSTLIVTHRLVGLETADEILVLQGGRVVERGRHYELLQTGEIYRHMWELQSRAVEEDWGDLAGAKRPPNP
jgi:ATP-binding cassette subfamily C protein CydC